MGGGGCCMLSKIQMCAKRNYSKQRLVLFAIDNSRGIQIVVPQCWLCMKISTLQSIFFLYVGRVMTIGVQLSSNVLEAYIYIYIQTKRMFVG